MIGRCHSRKHILMMSYLVLVIPKARRESLYKENHSGATGESLYDGHQGARPMSSVSIRWADKILDFFKSFKSSNFMFGVITISSTSLPHKIIQGKYSKAQKMGGNMYNMININAQNTIPFLRSMIT